MYKLQRAGRRHQWHHRSVRFGTSAASAWTGGLELGLGVLCHNLTHDTLKRRLPVPRRQESFPDSRMSRVDLKVVLLGNAMVGKTSLMERYVHDAFNGDRPYQNTIGTVFAAKRVQVNDVTLVLGIWDTAGSEKYDAMTRTYYRGAKAAVVCYDITKSSTFQRAKHWVRELRSIEENCKVYLCATKKDLCDEGFASDDPDMQNVVERYASGTQTKLFVTSSKTGENIVELFNEIVQDFASNPENLQKVEEAIVLSKKPGERYCCAT